MELKYHSKLTEVRTSHPCPICGAKVKTDYVDGVDSILTEEGMSCVVCGLYYTFAFGAWKIGIEEFVWIDFYDSTFTEEEQKKRYEEQELVLNLYKKLFVEEAQLTTEEVNELKRLEDSMKVTQEQIGF